MQDKFNCEVKFGFEQMNFIKVTEMLSQAFWSKDIKIAEVKQGAKNSALIVGTFHNNEQIAMQE